MKRALVHSLALTVLVVSGSAFHRAGCRRFEPRRAERPEKAAGALPFKGTLQGLHVEQDAPSPHLSCSTGSRPKDRPPFSAGSSW